MQSGLWLGLYRRGDAPRYVGLYCRAIPIYKVSTNVRITVSTVNFYVKKWSDFDFAEVPVLHFNTIKSLRELFSWLLFG